jgi:hypothetical protein
MEGAHLLVSWPAGGVLEDFIQEFHQELWRNLFDGFPSWVMESTVFPARVDLFLQGNNSAGQPMGGHIDSYQAVLFQEIDLVGQLRNVGEFERSGLFAPSPLELGEPAEKWGGGWVHGFHSRTMSCAISEVKFS